MESFKTKKLHLDFDFTHTKLKDTENTNDYKNNIKRSHQIR